MIVNAMIKEGQGMKYTILRRSNYEPDRWYAVAWTDSKGYADKIVHALNVCEDGEFKILCEDA